MEIICWIGSFLKATYFVLILIIGIRVELTMIEKPNLYKISENLFLAYMDNKIEHTDIPYVNRSFVIIRLLYFLLCILGITTNQWFLFGLLIIIGVVNSNFRSNIKYTNCLSLVILILILINEYIIDYRIHKIFINL